MSAIAKAAHELLAVEMQDVRAATALAAKAAAVLPVMDVRKQRNALDDDLMAAPENSAVNGSAAIPCAERALRAAFAEHGNGQFHLCGSTAESFSLATLYHADRLISQARLRRTCSIRDIGRSPLQPFAVPSLVSMKSLIFYIGVFSQIPRYWRTSDFSDIGDGMSVMSVIPHLRSGILFPAIIEVSTRVDDLPLAMDAP